MPTLLRSLLLHSYCYLFNLGVNLNNINIFRFYNLFLSLRYLGLRRGRRGSGRCSGGGRGFLAKAILFEDSHERGLVSRRLEATMTELR